jgi:DNA replication protein DnaC
MGYTYDELMQKLAEMNIPIRDLTPEQIVEEQVKDFNDSIGNLNEIDGFNCDRCHNKGFVSEVAHNEQFGYPYEKRMPCRCYKTRETLKRAKRSGLGNIITDYTFDKFIATDSWQMALKEKAQRFCNDDEADWFFVGGQVGSGKTHLCTAIAAHYIKAGYETQYMLWIEESKKLKALVSDYQEYQKAIAPYKNVPVLYIDDFLKTRQGEMPTQADISLAFEIINHRLMEQGKITIISSEKTLGEMLEYDEATMSRIFMECGEYKNIIERDIKKNYRLKG